MGLMKPRVSSYVDRGNELIAKGKTKQATYVEIRQSSPAGEDFSMTIDFDEENQADSFMDSLESYYEDFDIDEHIEMWIEAKRSGTSGVPSTRELVKDAEAIDGMILELSQALQKVNIPVLVGSYTPPDENGEGEKIVREFYGQGSDL